MAYDPKNLGRGEKIVYYAHRHYFVLIKNALQWILLFIFAMVITIFFATRNMTDFAGTIKTIVIFLGLIGLVVGIIGFAISFLLWKTEEYIITNERIIRIEGIISKNETATSLDKINDVETNQSLLGRLFGYGNVKIQTGSDQGFNQLDFLAKPHEFKKIMLNAKNRIYGDASDLAPDPRGRNEEEDGNQRRPRQAQVYDVPAAPRPPAPYPNQGQYNNVPPPAPAQPAYNDPRGYAPRPQPNYAQPPQAPISPSQIAEAIQQLARLRDSGAISEAEFQAKKNDLMNRM
jgi:membrane protein YdbS with pleckstrin-like domain